MHTFICGLCDCRYGQFVSFYKHFKKHSEEVAQDSFHICEDLPASERDVCEDQPESLEMPTFNCGICPASFITVCMLHEHLEKHESKGSYTLDMQSKTGYPSPQQYPCVRLGNAYSSSLSTTETCSISSNTRIKCKRGRPSKLEPKRTTENKRDIPPNHSPTTDLFHSGNLVVKVENSNTKLANVKEDSCLPGAVIKPTRGTSYRDQMYQAVEDVTFDSDTQVNSRPDRFLRSRHLDIQNEILETINLEPADTMNETSARNNCDERQNDVKDLKKNAEEDAFKNNKSDKETEEEGSKDINDDENNDIEDCSKDDRQDTSNAYNVSNSDADFEDEEENDYSDIEADVQSDNTDAEAESLKAESNDEENIERRQEESKRQTMYNFRQKLTSLTREKSRASLLISDRRKFLICEVCGMKKVKHMLVKHVEETHGRAKLSKEFLELLAELKVAIAKVSKKKVTVKNMKDDQLKDADYVPGKTTHQRKRGKCVKKSVKAQQVDNADNEQEKTIQSGSRKYIKKIKDQKDADYIPEVEFDRSRPVKVKNVCDNHVMLKFAGKDKRYAECIHCGIALRGDKIEKHEKAHNSKAGKQKFAPENMIKCEECGWVMQTKDSQWHKCSEFIIEERTEPGEKRVKTIKRKLQRTPCDVCGVFVKKYLYQSHLRTHSDARPFPCPKCSKAFKTKMMLRYHDMNVHGERSFQCDQCPWAFTSKARLKEHSLLHTGEQRFTCTTCGKQFKRSNQLLTHTYKHNAKSIYNCEECPKGYKSLQSLKTHVSAVHRNIRIWMCSWEGCGKRFKTNTHLRRHMLIHIGDKPEKCTICAAAFVQRCGLKVHMKQKHNTEEMPPRNPEKPFLGVVPQIIMPPSDVGDTGRYCGQTVMKTVKFTSAKSKTETEKQRYQLALQQLSLRGGQNTSSTVPSNLQFQNSLNEELSVGDAKIEQGNEDRNEANKQDCMDVEATQEEEKEEDEEVTQESGSEPWFSDDQSEQTDVRPETRGRLTASFMLECDGMSFFRIKKSLAMN